MGFHLYLANMVKPPTGTKTFNATYINKPIVTTASHNHNTGNAGIHSQIFSLTHANFMEHVE